jgi:hypothetical protein
MNAVYTYVNECEPKKVNYILKWMEYLCFKHVCTTRIPLFVECFLSALGEITLLITTPFTENRTLGIDRHSVKTSLLRVKHLAKCDPRQRVVSSHLYLTTVIFAERQCLPLTLDKVYFYSFFFHQFFYGVFLKSEPLPSVTLWTLSIDSVAVTWHRDGDFFLLSTG